ncbi:MAG: hypothetical protein LBR15_00390 [Methanobrevibacter sp.]|jgi:hypothetical protein|nr:hypothetical protein [Candidatus Methanovirga australis]
MDKKIGIDFDKFLGNEDFDNDLNNGSESELDLNNDFNNYPDSNYQESSTNTNYYNCFKDYSHILDDEGKIEYSNVIPLRRFVFTFILTFGFYGYYWFYKNMSLLKEYHGLEINVKFRTLVYIFVPLGNLVVLYDLINTMKYYINKKGIESYSPFLNIMGFMLFGFTPLGAWFYVNVQESFNEYWKMEQAYLPVQRQFNSAEITIIFFVWLVVFVLAILIAYFLMHYTISIRPPVI